MDFCIVKYVPPDIILIVLFGEDFLHPSTVIFSQKHEKLFWKLVENILDDPLKGKYKPC